MTLTPAGEGQRGTPAVPIRRADLLARTPPAADRAGLDPLLAAAFAADRRKVVVLDDDPTGTQTVHGVPVVTRWEVDDLRWALSQGTRVVYVLTNTRALSAARADTVNREVALNLSMAAEAEGTDFSIVSRGDSTLRGHFAIETAALTQELAVCGRPVDGIVFCPAYPEAGRVTADDEHWIVDGDWLRPVAASHYAADATFSFRTSHLPGYVEECTGGAVRAADVLSVTLEDIRSGGATQVAARLRELRDGRVVVINALDRSDLDVVTLALLEVEREGRHFIHRTGPSFVPSRGGITVRRPLTAGEIYQGEARHGHGLVVVGSHVDLTNRQVEELEAGTDIHRIQLDVRDVLSEGRRGLVVSDTVEQVLAALRDSDVLLLTSRHVVTGAGPAESLAIAQQVSGALVAAARQVVHRGRPRFLLAKGGITSSDVFTDALGARRAQVTGSLLPGMVSLWQAVDGADPGLPYVVFAGNVGGDSDLLTVVRTLDGPTATPIDNGAARADRARD